MAKFWWETPLGQARLTEARIDAKSSKEESALRTERAQIRRHEQRMYASARASRLTDGWNPTDSSADAELVSSLRNLRSRSRALVRDAAYAKRARTIVINNIIGTGIGMQAQVMTSRDSLNERVNDDIETQFADWCLPENCHTGGRLHFAHMERMLMGQVFDAGEVLIRKHLVAVGRSRVPLALEVIEAERLADEFSSPSISVQTGNEVRMGVEIDQFFRPVAYYIRDRHPNEVRWGSNSRNEIRRVPASEIIHLAMSDRWPQTRGEPWLHAVAKTFNDMSGYTEAEITRARVQACSVGAIETSEEGDSFGPLQEDGSYEMEVEPGVYKRLNPGEKFVAGSVTSPNPALDPFMRYMLREVAAGSGPSYESLSRDYSQSNYSSSRLALLDDRDLWRHFQWWFIRDFREIIHREWLQQAVLSRAVTSIPIADYGNSPQKFQAVRFKPRGWSWVDPTKEVKAYIEAVEAGFMTVGDVISQTGGGRDLEEVLNERERELKRMREKGLVFTTSPEHYDKDDPQPDLGPDPPPKREEEEDPESPPSRRVFSLRRRQS